MSEIQTITTRIRHQEWADEINERIRSSQPVDEWCSQHGLSKEGYRYRLRVVRKEALALATSSFAELSEPAMPTAAQSVTSEPSMQAGGISIDINGAVIRFDSNTQESLITTAVRAVRNA